METDLVLMTFMQKFIWIFALLFITGSFVFGYLFPENANANIIKIPDRFDIGYIDDLPPVIVKQKAKTYTHKPKKPSKQAKKTVETRPLNDELIKDCISALVNLGEKRSSARAAVNKHFINYPETQTVDEFIAGVFKK